MDVAVNSERSLVQRTANNESVKISRKNPFTSATVALPVMSVGKTKATYIMCHKECKGLLTCIFPRSARVDIFIQQGVLVPDGVKCCVSHLKNKHLQARPEVGTSEL